MEKSLRKHWLKIVLIIVFVLFLYPKKCGNWGTSIEATYTQCSCLGIKFDEPLPGGGRTFCIGICLKNTCRCVRFDPRYPPRGLIPCEELEYELRYTEITERTCDATIPCPEGLECIAFPHIREPRCAQPDPCSYYKCPTGTKCLVGETYPLQVFCSPQYPR